jgi:hypothetical protein
MNRATRICLLVLVGGMACGMPSEALARQSAPVKASAAGKASDSLPISRITLYRSGVGSFERRGSVDGDATVQLKFNTDQVNDILKSMVVLDLSGGSIQSVGYGSKDPLSRRLASFGINIADNPSMSAILNRLRGTKVTVTTAEGTTQGTVLGVETRREILGESEIPTGVDYLNLFGAGMRSIKLADVRALQIEDAELNAELEKALAALADQRADRVKTVEIAARGNGRRDLAVSYVHETPVWKTSYRLVVPEDVKGDAGKLTLQGWAIVENTTDEDWKDVRLSLVANQPVSFRMDLYEPLYTFRPEVAVPTGAGASPRVYDMGLGMAKDVEELAAVAAPGALESRGRYSEEAAKSMRREDRMADAAVSESAIGFARAPSSKPGMTAANMAQMGRDGAAQGGESGEIFRYELSAPVTIERQRSAMLPIVGTQVDGRRVSIYNRADGQEHPMRGLELTNSTALQLMPGPLSVFDGVEYAGDAQIGHVPAGEKRLLSYAVDLELGVTTNDRIDSTVQKVRLVRGVLEQTVKEVRTSDYVFDSKDKQRGRTLIIEEQRLGGYELVGIKATETTPVAYRFEVKLDAGKAGKLSVQQERTAASSYSITDMDTPRLIQFCKNGKASEAVLNAVRDLGSRRAGLEQARAKVRGFEQNWADIEKDQGRLRQNMESVDKASQLYAQYMQKMTAQEAKLDDLGPKIEAARGDVARLEKELGDFIASLNVE